MKTEILQDIFNRMYKIRLTEETIAERYSEQKMRCPTHLSIGQEGIASGVCVNLTDEDIVLSTHRAHAHYLAKGGSLNSMIAEIYGKETGCSKGKGGSMHLIDKSCGFFGSTAIVGNTIPVAVGVALSQKIRNSESICCVFFGDGAVEEGVFYEAANFAALKKLPILFVCENNLYSVYSPLNVRQPVGREIYKMVNSIGIDSIKCDGNKPDEVFATIKRLKKELLDGEGPKFVELDTYRWREHCGPNYDNDIGYRTIEEYELWKEKDPISYFEAKYGDNIDLSVKDLINQEIDRAFQFAEESPFPKPEEIYTHLYSD